MKKLLPSPGKKNRISDSISMNLLYSIICCFCVKEIPYPHQSAWMCKSIGFCCVCYLMSINFKCFRSSSCNQQGASISSVVIHKNPPDGHSSKTCSQELYWLLIFNLCLLEHKLNPPVQLRLMMMMGW